MEHLLENGAKEPLKIATPRSIPRYSNTPQLPTAATACLPVSAPTAPSHCRHCEQLQGPMPMKNPGAKAAVEVPRPRGLPGIDLGDSDFAEMNVQALQS